MWTVAPSRIQGYGIICTHPIEAGTSLGVCHWCSPWDGQWNLTELGRYHNHSYQPTARSQRVGNYRYLVALCNLQPGDEVTVDYRQQPDLEQPVQDWR